MQRRQKLVLVTAFLALFLLGGAFAYKVMRPETPLVLNLQGQPSIGTGQVEIVIFEDFCCSNCRLFIEQIFPKIISLYIDTGKAHLVFIPVSFGENSMPLANACLSVYHLAPSQFIAFIQELSLTQAETLEGILSVAQKVGEIPLKELETSIQGHMYDAEITQNLIWARSVMGEEFGTPTLLINGFERSTESFEEISLHMVQGEGR